MVLTRADGGAVDLADAKQRLQAAFLVVMSGAAESDGYNALVLAAGLMWREVALVRTVSRYLRQIRVPYSQDYMWATLVKHAPIAAAIVRLFHARFDPRSNQVYVAHAEKSIAAIDAKSMALNKDIALPGSAEGFEAEADRPRLYVNVPPNLVVVIDTDKNEVTGQYTLNMSTGNTPLALDAANHRLFLGCRKEPMVVVMDSETGKEITSVPIPGGIDDLSFDAKRKQMYASCGDGYLVVIKQEDPDHYKEIARMETAKGAKTSFFDDHTGRLYLGVPRQEDPRGVPRRSHGFKLVQGWGLPQLPNSG